MIHKGFKSGFIAIVGRPNVGKSTLLNRLLGQKIAIVSAKPQTTWSRILGIKTLPGAQLVFLDTPGIHHAQAFFNREMVKTALKAAEEADLVLWIVDATEPLTEDDRLILESLRKSRGPLILALNKVDLLEKGKLLPMIKSFSQLPIFQEIVPISAAKGDNLERLEEIEWLLGTKVYLGLWVKVKKGWKKDEAVLRRLGYIQK
ncbi:MAG: GTPase Era [candidate division NC10 bacterium]|nr:GTPase Era [candidate division NC10 bacterium]